MTEAQKLPDFNVTSQPVPNKGGMGMGSIIILTTLLVFSVIVGVALMQSRAQQPMQGTAPDFTFTTFDGEEMSLRDLRGNVVVLNFWASWCGPCKLEAPALENTWQAYADRGDVVFLGIAYADNGPRSLEFMETYGITYLNAPDLGTRISELYNIQGVPETFIIDKEGKVAEFIYAGVTEEQLTTSLDKVLQEG